MGHRNNFNDILPAEMALNVANIQGMMSGANYLWDMHSQTGHGYKIDITVTGHSFRKSDSGHHNNLNDLLPAEVNPN